MPKKQLTYTKLMNRKTLAKIVKLRAEAETYVEVVPPEPTIWDALKKHREMLNAPFQK